MKRIAKSLALLLASSIFTLLMAEGILHLVPDLLPIEVRQALNSKGRAYPEIGNLPEPNSEGVIVTRDFESPYRLDKNGFRNSGDWPDDSEIVVIGDSLVFGYGVDEAEAWPQLLAESTGKDVLNLGLIGASPQQYRKLHETFGRSMNPAIVIVGFFARNDYWDADMFAAWERSGASGNYLEWRGFGRPTAKQYQDPLYRILYESRKRSYILALFKFGKNALSGREVARPTELSMPSGETMLLHGADYRIKTRLSEPDEDTFELVVDQLRQIRDATLDDGSRLIVLLQPAKEEIYKASEDAELPDATVELRQRLDQLEIEFIDAIPAFRQKAENGETLYFQTDGHPNADGYKALAELVTDYLDKSTNSSAM